MNAGSKSILRTSLLAKRRAVSVQARQQAAMHAADRLAATALFQQSQHIACYYPTYDEFDCLPLIQKIWQAEKKCYLPQLSADENKKLAFSLYRQADSLRLNRYQIFEPAHSHPIAVEQLDIVLMPLVGFDLTGHRLGMGLGYYDRTFDFVKIQTTRTCYLLGLAFDRQCVTTLPFDPWDVSLSGVMTEKKMIVFRAEKI